MHVSIQVLRERALGGTGEIPMMVSQELSSTTTLYIQIYDVDVYSQHP